MSGRELSVKSRTSGVGSYARQINMLNRSGQIVAVFFPWCNQIAINPLSGYETIEAYSTPDFWERVDAVDGTGKPKFDTKPVSHYEVGLGVYHNAIKHYTITWKGNPTLINDVFEAFREYHRGHDLEDYLELLKIGIKRQSHVEVDS